MAPTVCNSADTIHHDRIAKKGDKFSKHVLVKVVYIHMRHALNSDISRSYRRNKAKNDTVKTAIKQYRN